MTKTREERLAEQFELNIKAEVNNLSNEELRARILKIKSWCLQNELNFGELSLRTLENLINYVENGISSWNNPKKTREKLCHKEIL